MDFEKDYYAVLGVLPSIEASALRAVYLTMQKIYHPDVCSSSKADAEARIKVINEAYAVLSAPALRAKYDAAQATKRKASGSSAEDAQAIKSRLPTFTRYKSRWKAVSGDYTRPSRTCPRCHNMVSYFLAWDSDTSLSFSGLFEIPVTKTYAYKCSICPNHEPISNELAKAIKSGKKKWS